MDETYAIEPTLHPVWAFAARPENGPPGSVGDEWWVAAYRLSAHRGRHVIAEARLYPFEEEAAPGEWSGTASSVSGAGVPWEKLRELQTDGALEMAQAIIEDWSADDARIDYLNQVFDRFELNRLATTEPIPKRHRRRLDSDVARGAAEYASAPSGQRLKAVARALVCSESNASKVIRDARSRGFLAAAELTPRGRNALKGESHGKTMGKTVSHSGGS